MRQSRDPDYVCFLCKLDNEKAKPQARQVGAEKSPTSKTTADNQQLKKGRTHKQTSTERKNLCKSRWEFQKLKIPVYSPSLYFVKSSLTFAQQLLYNLFPIKTYT